MFTLTANTDPREGPMDTTARMTITDKTRCTHSPACPIHPTCDGGCPPAGQAARAGVAAAAPQLLAERYGRVTR